MDYSQPTGESKRTRIVLAVWTCSLVLIAALSAYATAGYRPLWHDEVYTAAVSRLESPARIWDALTHAVETNPPLFYIMEASTRRLAVSEEFGLRLPALIGFLVFVGSVAVFVWRALGPLSGLLAAAVLASSETLYYASEARPYGALLGAFGLAAILWQHRKHGSRSPVILVFLILCLAFACSLHYYAVLGVMMFGLADLLEGIRVRKLDWPFLLTLPLALIPVLIALPLVRAASSTFSGAFWARSSPKSIGAAYVFIFSSPQLSAFRFARLRSGREIGLGEVFLLSVLILAACGMVVRWRKTPKPLSWPRPELLLAFAFLLLPLVTGLVGMLTTGVFTPRYVLASTIGVAVLSGWLLAAWNRKFAFTVAAVLTLALIWNEVPATFHKHSALASGETPGSSMNKSMASVFQMIDAGNSVVVSGAHVYLQAFHYASPKHKSSLFYLEDRESALRLSGTDTNDAGFLKLQPYEGIHVPYAPDFLRANREFILLSGGEPQEWLPEYLRRTNARIQPLSVIGALTLSKVQLP
ncbi:MAG: hypothetical protein LAP61_20985 [Acidobacteriia bacterium]|nr:hypothetical protein [Terriglobia bacterium]